MTYLQFQKTLAIVACIKDGSANLEAIALVYARWTRDGYDIELTLREDGIAWLDTIEGDLDGSDDWQWGRFTMEDYRDALASI